MTSKNNSENVFETDESDIEKEDQCDDDDDDEGSLDDVKIETDDNTRVRIVMELILEARMCMQKMTMHKRLCFFFQTRKRTRVSQNYSSKFRIEDKAREKRSSKI